MQTDPDRGTLNMSVPAAVTSVDLAPVGEAHFLRLETPLSWPVSDASARMTTNSHPATCMDMKHLSAFLTRSALYLGMPLDERQGSNRCAPHPRCGGRTGLADVSDPRCQQERLHRNDKATKLAEVTRKP